MNTKKGMKAAKLLKSFLPYYGKYKKVLILDLFCAALTTLGELVLPLILRFITNQGMQDLASLTTGLVVKIGLLYLILRVIDSLAAYYMAYTGHVMGVYIETDMRQDAFEHLQMLSDSYYSNTKVGQIMSRITSDLFDVTEFSHHCPEEFFIAILKGIVSFVILSGINLELTLLIFLMIPIMIVSCTWFNLKVKAAFRLQRNQIGELNAQIEDTLLGNRVVRAFANEPVEIEKFGKGNREFMKIKKHTYRYMAAFQITTRSFDGLMYVLVIVAGGLFMINGKIAPGDLVAYTMYVTTLLTTIRRIIEFAEQFQRGMTGIERFQEIMDVTPDIRDKKGAKPLSDVKGTIEFDHVSFEYADDHTQVLNDICLKIRPGERIALVGPSGGGKTTLCNLIARFWDVQGGEILVGCHNVKEYKLDSLMKNISMVFQDLFNDTIENNIRFGKQDATHEEVVEAAKAACCHDFIMSLPEGYDTVLEEGGGTLSGGEKQRISIARAMLKDAPIIILDEATSSVDPENEAELQKAIDVLIHNKTIIMIAHRLKTVRNADQILVLNGGKITQRGTHEELSAQSGLYADFIHAREEAASWKLA